MFAGLPSEAVSEEAEVTEGDADAGRDPRPVVSVKSLTSGGGMKGNWPPLLCSPLKRLTGGDGEA